MDSSIQLFIYFVAGITMAFAATNLIIAVQKGSEKTYLFLGLMGLCVGIYFLLFPIAFVYSPTNIVSKIALLFFLSSFGLLPWFICYYTAYCKRKTQWLLSAGMASAYAMLIFTSNFTKPVIWNIFAHLVLVGIIYFGFLAAIDQHKKRNKRSARLLLSALVILSILTLEDIVRMHFGKTIPFGLPENILPLDYFLVFFMIIIGLKLARDMQKKYQLERSLNVQEKRWATLLEKIQMLAVGVDKDEKIYYVNPYFLKTTGLDKSNIIGHHYLDLIPENSRKAMQDIANSVETPEDLPYYENSILTIENKEITIGWSLVGIYDENGYFTSSISIGSDVTDERNAFEEIIQLKSRLEEENVLLRTELGKVSKAGEITGESDAIKYVLQRGLQVASTDSTVLLEGETGVGKELIANFIQENSLRKKKNFIKVNCAAIPSTLLESELFGHVKGAFTGADRNKKGLVEMADEGTLLLDEIGEFPMELQPKLLRFLQEGEYQPLGSETPKKVDVRIIAATNRELLKEIDEGRFRNDLYYRLYVYPITIPSLRNRKDDIPLLVDFFVKYYTSKYGKVINKVSKLVIDELKKYPWPGNVRELENVMERAVIVATSDTIKLKDLSPVIANKTINKSQKPLDGITTLEFVEREHIIKALKFTSWQVHGSNGGAELLGINPSTLRSRMKKLNIIKP